MIYYLESLYQSVFILLLFITIQLQENRSEFAENNSRLTSTMTDDLERNELEHHEKNLASSPDTTTKVDPHYKFNEHDKPHYNPKHFGYHKHNGPSLWPKMFHMCGGHSQSPVNLDTTTAVTQHRPRIMWWNYALKPRVMTIANNGHTVVLTAKWTREEDKPYHWSPPNTEEYVFDQLHFHWGEDDHSGSEHTLNNEKFALEMHAVHHRRDFKTLEHAGHFIAGIRVIGVLYRISETEHNNTGLQQIVDILQSVRVADTSILLPEQFALSRLVPQFSNLYITYNGSLTTPPCAETVSWVIRKEPLTVSRRQVEEFRNLMDHEGHAVNHNYRPIQPLNGRKVIQIR